MTRQDDPSKASQLILRKDNIMRLLNQQISKNWDCKLIISRLNQRKL